MSTSRIRIVYMVSTLDRVGPTKQLLGLIAHLDTNLFEPIVVTLSSEPETTMCDRFEKIGVPIVSMKLGRFAWLLRGRTKLKELLKRLHPEILHTQGIRADRLALSSDRQIACVMTSRNFPPVDYVMKFGSVKGRVMAFLHLGAFRAKRANVVSCSYSIASQLSAVGVDSHVIHNGVQFSVNGISDIRGQLPDPPVLVVVGSLIARKNVGKIINASRILAENVRHRLVIVGDGILADSLKLVAGPHVTFTGRVDQVDSILGDAACFLSASVSEGLPNAVLEALSLGVPCFLSDIPPHRELSRFYQEGVKLFDLLESDDVVASSIASYIACSSKFDSEAISNTTKEKFSSEIMSKSYQNLYKELIKSDE